MHQVTPLSKLDDLLDRAARRWGDAPAALVLLAPAALVLATFHLWPFIKAIQLSLYGGKFGSGSFVGLKNYADALQSPDFWQSTAVTAYYLLGTVPATLVLSFFIACLLYTITIGRGFFRTVWFLPYVTSAVAAAMVWRAILNPQSGLANALLITAGWPAQQWLLEPRGVLHLLSGGVVNASIGPSLALCCIIFFDIWHGLGFMIVVFLASLTAMPRELLEAARVDGANAWHTVRHVIAPLLSPTIFFLTIVGGIRALQSFNSFYALTQGGGRTLGTTENLILHIYAQFYEYNYWGYGAAVATILSFAIVILTLLQWRLARGRVFYQ